MVTKRTVAGVNAIQRLEPAARRTFKTIVFESLYELIQDLEFPPGERLVEAELAERFGLSKTPVREALLMLEREGLVTAVPHTGATVTWLSLADYEQQLFILDALELPALELVLTRISSSRLKAVSQAVASMQEAQRAGRHDRYRALAVTMHHDLFAAVRYPRLSELIESVHRSLRRYAAVFIHQFDDNWSRDAKIALDRIERLSAGDAAGAAEAVRTGHADLFEFAARKVADRDPMVEPYVVRSPSPPRS